MPILPREEAMKSDEARRPELAALKKMLCSFCNEMVDPEGHDAIAQAVRLADAETFDRAVCLIMTDGEENSSRETTKQQVVEIIKAHEAKGNWSFAYIGENPERWARETGTSVRNTAQYNHGDPQASFVAASVGIQISRRSAESKFDHVLDPDAAKKDDA